MKTNIEVVLVVILIILNLLIGGFFIFIFLTINTPDLYAEIEITDLTSDEIKLQTLIDIKNDNSFDLILKDVNIMSKTIEGNDFTSYQFKGGIIPSSEKKSFKSEEQIKLQGDIPKVIVNSITANVGIKLLGFIEKIIPLKAVVVLSVEDFINNISIPKIKIHGGISGITDEGLQFTANIGVLNPSKIELNVNDIFVKLKNEKNESVGSINLKGGKLLPKETLNLDVTGIIEYEALNSKSINIDVEGDADINIAGLNQTITLSTAATIDVPNISDLLKLNNDSFDFSLSAEFKVRLRGVITTFQFKIFNPSNIPLEARDIKAIIYGITGDYEKVIFEEDMKSCVIYSKNEVCVSTQIRIPYLKLILSGTGRLFPEWFSLKLEGNFAINGTTQLIPISISGYLDPHLFR